MAERIFIGVAWPYANGALHIGHLAGCYLPADIFARYHRLKGNEVLMVSGSDQHGTPVTVTAEQEGLTPKEVAERCHAQFIDCWNKLGISWDLFTSTGTNNHTETVHKVFLDLLNKGLIYKHTTMLPYCLVGNRFLPDRYVNGTCPYCNFAGARGDQCDNCGKPLDPKDLKDIKCRFHGDTPVLRDSEHFFLKLSAFESELASWVSRQSHWRPNVANFTSRYLADGLKDRAITRDLEWGITIPLEGYEHKRIYVWFEAVIGYLSASKQWANEKGDAGRWKDFWFGDTRHYYFIGKDNIPFHTIIWPAMLLGYDRKLNLPYDVPANEFLNLQGLKFSKSRNWAVWVPDYLERFAPDPLRYVLSANMPETSDTDFTWQEYIRRNNDELVATYGNLAHRVLSFTHRSYEGKVPEHDSEEDLDESSRRLLARADETLAEVDKAIALCHFRDGIKSAMSLAQEANRYLDDKAPWKTIKTDRKAAANSLWVTMCAISALKTVLYPYLPWSSEQLNRFMGFEGPLEKEGWAFRKPAIGQTLSKPEHLFAKLDESIIEQEMANLGQDQNKAG